MASINSQTSVIIENLLENTSDKSEKVRSSIYASLRKIASCYPSEVISASIKYRRRNPKLTYSEARSIFELIKDVCDCEQRLSKIESTLLAEIISIAVEESLKASSVPFMSADVLPVVGSKYCEEVLNELQKHMSEGVAPYASVVYALGHIAVANMSSFHPHSVNVCKYLLSILQVTKSDSMRKLYAQTVSQLVETIVEQMSTENSSVTKEQYSLIVEEIFDAFMTTWLQIKDASACEMITQAAGLLVLLFSDQKLTNDTSNILNSFLQLYKKEKPSSSFPRYVITQGVSNFLSVVPRAALQPHLDTLLNTLHTMVIVTPDFNLPVTVKNHNEILRCYDYLSGLFEDKLTEVLLNNLRSSPEQDRIAGLIVATYLLNSANSILKPKVTELIAALHKLLNESSTKINKNMATIINVLAFRGYLSEKDAVFIEFLARHSYHTSPANAEQDDLESSCRNTLGFLNTATPAVQSLCWKVLIQLLMNGEHLQAVTVFAKSLAYLISECELSILERNCYDRSEIIFVRVISLLGSPLHDNRGIHLLTFLKDYIQWKVKIDPLIWKSKITEVISYLTASDTLWNDIEWENRLLSALTASFTDDTKPWLEAVNVEAIKLLSENQTAGETNSNNYANNVAVDERAMLFKLVALISQYIDDSSIVTSNITKILSPLSQRSLIDLRACSRSVGIISRSHFNHVFNELDKFQRAELNRKPTKFLGLIKDTKGETEVEIIRRMICECFSSILVEALPRAMLPKFKQMMHWFISLHQITKDVQTLSACSEALLHVSEVLLKNENDYEHVDECRKELLNFITNTVQSERNMPSVTCLKTIATLFKLSSSTSATEKLHLLQKCLNKMFQYYSMSSSTSAITEAGVIEVDPIIQQLCILIEHSVDTKNSTVLEEIVMFLRQWLSHKVINHRIVSLFLLKSALNSYVICYFNDTKNYVKFTTVGSLLGRLYVRTFETNTELSHIAWDCIILLFAIAEANVDNASTSVEDIQKSMSSVDINFFRVSVYCKLSPDQLHSFTTELLNGLLDNEDPCATGTAELLKVLFTELGTQLHRQALEIFGDMMIKLMKLENKTVLKAAVDAVLALARHSKDMFVSTMLNQSIPFHPNISACWCAVSSDDQLADDMLKRLYETLKNHPTREDDPKNKKLKILSVRPLIAMSSMNEILTYMPDTSVLATSHFIDLFPLLLTLIPLYMGEVLRTTGAANGVGKVNKDMVGVIVPARLVFDTLAVLMKRSRCVDANENVAKYAEKVDFRTEAKASYYELVKHLAKNVSRFNSEIVSKILDMLGGFASNDKTESQRGTAVIFFVEIFNLKCCEDAILVDTVILNLLSFLSDTSYFVRENSLKGLANISNLEFSLVERYKERLLSALKTGFEDNEATTQIGIIIQSLLGLSKLLPFLTGGQYASICISIAIRIKPFFEKENAEVRSLSLRLFGELASVPSIEVSSFREQVTSNLLCLLFHLGEKEPEVVDSCKFTLKAISKMMKSEFLATQIVTDLNEDSKKSYNDYLIKVTKTMAEELPEKSGDLIAMAISYTKSSWPEIRAAASLFIGTMYSHQTQADDKLPVDVLSRRILALLKDIDANVRANAATALGLLLHSASSEFLASADEQ